MRAGEETDGRPPRQAEEKGRGVTLSLAGAGGGRRGQAPGTGAKPERPPPPAFHCGPRVRPWRRRRGAGAGGGGGRRNRPQLGPGPPLPRPAVSGGTRSQSPQPTAGSPRPGPRRSGLCASFSPGVFLSRLLWSPPRSLSHTRLSVLPTPRHSLLRGKFLNFDELFQRTFLKGAARVWVELEVPGRRAASPAGAAVLPLPCLDVGL